MKKVLSILAVLSILSLGLVVGSQANTMAQNGFTTYRTDKMLGIPVKSRDGVQLGEIFDLLADSNGHVDFAIIGQPGFEEFPGRFVVVPMSTLTISKAQSGKMSVVFNLDKEKFYEGPDWGNENLANLKQAASVYTYYGLQPYWTEGAGKASCHE